MADGIPRRATGAVAANIGGGSGGGAGAAPGREGGHFDAYVNDFDRAANPARDWFVTHLLR